MGKAALDFPLSFDEFLIWDEQRPGTRYEFVAGEVRAMVGETKVHNRAAFRLASALEQHLSSPCQVYVLNVRLRLAENARLPDVLVTCDARDHADPLLVRYPIFIAEVLSKSTVDTDRIEKLEEYRAIDCLQEYLLIDPEARWAELHRRRGKDWSYQQIHPDGDLELASLDFRCRLATLFG
jgi:Uma2 family endonuclease